MTGDASVLVAEQRFPILLSHASSTQSSPKGVLQVVYAVPGKAVMCRPQELLLPLLCRPNPRLLPGRVVHAVNRRFIPLVIWLAKREHVEWMLAGYRIQLAGPRTTTQPRCPRPLPGRRRPSRRCVCGITSSSRMCRDDSGPEAGRAGAVDPGVDGQRRWRHMAGSRLALRKVTGRNR